MVAAVNVLVVEDNDALREVTVEVLQQAGYRVLGLSCAEDLDTLALLSPVSVAVLDLNLPGVDGFALAARLRASCPNIAIIMVTVRGQLEDKLRGYEHGADVYLTKPTAPEELCAAVGAFARRFAVDATETDAHGSGWHLDLEQGCIDGPVGRLMLSDIEVMLLHAFMLAPSGVLEHWQLLELLKKSADEHGKGQLEAMISRLRRKLQAIGADRYSLRAMRGIGYRLDLSIRLR